MVVKEGCVFSLSREIVALCMLGWMKPYRSNLPSGQVFVLFWTPGYLNKETASFHSQLLWAHFCCPHVGWLWVWVLNRRPCSELPSSTPVSRSLVKEGSRVEEEVKREVAMDLMWGGGWQPQNAEAMEGQGMDCPLKASGSSQLCTCFGFSLLGPTLDQGLPGLQGTRFVLLHQSDFGHFGVSFPP